MISSPYKSLSADVHQPNKELLCSSPMPLKHDGISSTETIGYRLFFYNLLFTLH